MFDLLRPYITIVRLWVVIVLLVSTGGYVGYLRYKIHESDQELIFLKEAVALCSNERSQLRSMNHVQAENMEALTEYYRHRKCLDPKDGELTEEELRLE